MTETLEQKIIWFALDFGHTPQHMQIPEYETSRKAFNLKVKELFGDEAFSIAKGLWRDGYLMMSGYGYVEVSVRGHVLYSDGKRTPREKREKTSLEQALDNLWRVRNAEFRSWLEKRDTV